MNIEHLRSNTNFEFIHHDVTKSYTEFSELNYNNLKLSNDAIIFDTKGFLDRKIVSARL